jgi:hypothetical protein
VRRVYRCSSKHSARVRIRQKAPKTVKPSAKDFFSWVYTASSASSKGKRASGRIN